MSMQQRFVKAECVYAHLHHWFDTSLAEMNCEAHSRSGCLCSSVSLMVQHTKLHSREQQLLQQHDDLFHRNLDFSEAVAHPH